MSDITATRTVESAAVGQRVPARRFNAVSGNKLTYSLFATTCPSCGEPRIHNSDGPRRCPGCKAHYVLVVTPAGTAA